MSSYGGIRYAIGAGAASGAASVTISGVDHLLRWLGGKPSKAADRATRRGITRGAKLLLAQQRNLAPVRTKLLWKALGYKIRKYGMVYFGIVGIRRGFRVKVKEIVRNRIVGIASKRVKGEVRERQIKLLAAKRIQVGQYINPTRYGHLANRKKPFIWRAMHLVKRAVQDEIVAGLRGELR